MKNSVINQVVSNRRTFLKRAGAAFAATPVLTEQADAGQELPQVLYAHGLVWNTDLPGAAGELVITFDVWVMGGTGLGTFADAVHTEFNSQVVFASATRHGNVYALEGAVLRSNDAGNVGTAVTAVLETFGDSTFAEIRVGDFPFRGSGIMPCKFL